MRLWRYLGLRFAAATLLCWAVLVALVLAVVWVEGAGHAAKLQSGALAALWLAGLGSVQVAWQMLPVACLLGLVVCSTQLARAGEWVGLLALGIAPWRLAAPFVAVACCACGVGWAMAEYVLPPLAELHVGMQAATTGRVDAATRAFGRKEHWFRRGNTVLYLPRTPQDDAACLLRPTLYEVADGTLLGVTDARALRWQDNRWQLEGATTFQARPRAAPVGLPAAGAPDSGPAVAVACAAGAGQAAAVAHGAESAGAAGAADVAHAADAAEAADAADRSAAAAWNAVGALPQALAQTHGPPKQQRGAALRALIARREAAGIPTLGHRLEALERRAYPTLCLLLVLLGLPWALLPDRHRSLVGMLGKAAGVVAVALATSQAARMAVAASLLPDWLGAWLVPALAAATLPLSARRAARGQ